MSVKRTYLPTRISKRRSFLLIALLIILYVIENSPVTRLVSSFSFNYIIMPILWISLTIIVWRLPHIRPKAKLKLKKLIYFWAFNFAVIYTIISFLLGLIDGLGKSPYNHSITGIFMNIIFIVPPLIGREFLRSYIVRSLAKEEKYLIFTFLAF